MTKSIKPHYPVLDGLRGVAAITVVAWHLFEANAENLRYQFINHGYLAVDFFFLLSGFVISYAYDDRWGTMSFQSFVVKRIERLQPLVILGMIVGAALFYFGDSERWPLIHTISVWKVLLVTFAGFFLIPLPLSQNIRGWDEMYPINGAAWSLFYEYLANIAYGLFLRKASIRVLILLAVLSGAYLTFYTFHAGDILGGWSFTTEQLNIGFIRVTFPFIMGMILARKMKITAIPNGFLYSSLLLLSLLFMPRLGGDYAIWINGIYEAFVIMVMFPLIIYIGASAVMKENLMSTTCKFLGDLSYPIYITHFPIIYLYSAWISDHRDRTDFHLWTTVYGLLTFISSIALGYLALKYYDEPVRKYIRRKIFVRNQ